MPAMETIPTQTMLDQLNWRYATKRFDPSRRIPDETWNALEDSLVLTPSSFGLQPWRFVVVTDPAVKERLVPASWGQTQPAECSHYVVFAAKTDISEAYIDHYLRRMADVRNVEVDSLSQFSGMLKGYLLPPPAGFDVRRWTALQTYIALGNFMTCAAMLGVDTCPMEGIEPAKYDELVGLTGSGFATVVACAAGYRGEGDRHATLAKVRFDKSEVIQRV